MGEVLNMLAILIMLVVLAVLALPFLPVKCPITLAWFNFPEEKRHKNLIYIASTLVVILLTILLMPYILRLAEWVRQTRLIVWLRSLVPNHALYTADIFRSVFANVFFCVVVMLVHWITGALFGRFPKFSLEAWRAAWKEAKAKRAAKKKPSDPKTPTQQPTDPNALPPSCFLTRSRRILKAVCWCKAPVGILR